MVQIKRSTQWDLIGLAALTLAFISFYSFTIQPPPTDKIIKALGNPFLMAFFFLFTFMCFLFGYLETRKQPKQT